MDKQSKIVLPGGAGLVGQNLVIQLKQMGIINLTVIDKHRENTKVLRKLHPDIEVIEADLAKEGAWQKSLEGSHAVVMLQAQIGAKSREPFFRNNIEATRLVLVTMKKYQVPYLVHIGTSATESVIDDYYTETKKEQEKMAVDSGIEYVVLRPTLMFGWFDRKHLGWLSRFMQRVPVFPIPGHGRHMRQPLYVRDFCNIVVSCLELRPANRTYNISGQEKIDYIDVIREIRRAVRSHTLIVKLPLELFHYFLKIWALFYKTPPFTAQQLEALVAKDEFELIDWPSIFKVKPTPFREAIQETFNHPVYSQYELEF